MREQLINQRNLTRKLRLLLVLLSLTLMPIGVWAQTDYGITVGGVAVTSANADNVTGVNIEGTVSYKESSNTLTLSGATIMDGMGIQCAGDLNLSIIGDVTVNGSITSSSTTGATLTLKHGDGNAATLTYNITTGGATTGFTSVVYDGMYLTPAVYDGNFNLTDGNRRDVKYSPTRQRFEESEGYSTSTVKFTSAMNYELWVGGTKVTFANKDDILGSQTTPATAMFDPSNNTLTLNGISLSSNRIYDSGIISRLSALTIIINGENTITCNDSCTAIRADMEGEQTLTISKGSDNSSLVFNSYQAIRDFKTLSLTGLEWNNNYTYKYFDNSPNSYGSGYKLLKTDNSEASIDEDTKTKPILYGTDVIVYDLWVAGHQVSSINESSIGGRGIGGSGSISFNGVNNTLEMNNAEISVTDMGGFPIVSGLTDLNIKLIGYNTAQLYTAYDIYKYFVKYTGEAGLSPKLTFQTDWSSDANNQLCLGSLNIEGTSLTANIADGFTVQNTLNGTTGWMTEEDATNDNLSLSYGGAYQLSVAGTLVTDANKGDVLGDGKVSFSESGATAPVYTLTLNGATLTEPIKVGLSNLTIDIKGTNSITTSERCIQKIDNTTPAVTFKSTSTEVGSLSLNGSTGVYGVGYGTFSINDQFAVVLFKDDRYYSNQYWFTDGSTIKALLTPSYGLTVGGMQIGEGNAADITGEGIGDGSVGASGMVRFNKATNTLTLKDASLSGIIKTSLPNLIIDLDGSSSISSSDDHTFQSPNSSATMTIKSSTKNGRLSMGMSYTSSNQGNFCDDNVSLSFVGTTLVSGSLTGNAGNYNAVIATTYDLTVAGVQVNSENASNISGTNITGGTVSFTPANGTNGNILTLNGVTLTESISWEDDADLTIEVKGNNSISLDGPCIVTTQGNNSNAIRFIRGDASNECVLTLNSGTSQSNVISGFANSTSPTVTDINWYSRSADRARISTDYGLTIAGVVVSASNNASTGITGTGIAGKVTYTPTAKTLTLENATITYDGTAIVWENTTDDLTVHVVGANTIDGRSTANNNNIAFDGSTKLNFITLDATPGYLNMLSNIYPYEVNVACGGFTPLYTGLSMDAIDDGLQLCYHYPLKVVGKQVTNANLNNIHDNTTSVSFNPDTKTLTLDSPDGFNVAGYASPLAGIESGYDNLIVKLKNSTGLTCNGTNDVAFKGTVADAKITFTCDASSSPDLQIMVYEGKLTDNVTLLYNNGLTLFSTRDKLGSLAVFSIAKAPWEGSGTATAPFLIKSAADLVKLAEQVNNGTISKETFKLDATTIDCNSVSGFTPIGTTTYPFLGTFDGGGNTISNLTVSSSNGYAGLFGQLGDYDGNAGTVKNLNIKDCTISGTGTYSGAVVGYVASGDVFGCNVEGNTTVSCVGASGANGVYAGAIVGGYAGAAFRDNTYEYSVVTSTKVGTDAAVEKKDYTHRGMGKEDSSTNDCDVFSSNGAVMAGTKIAAIPQSAAVTGGDISPMSGTYYRLENNTTNNTRELYVVSGKAVALKVTPTAGYCAPSLVVLTASNAAVTVSYEQVTDAQTQAYEYTTCIFTMPDENVTADVIFPKDISNAYLAGFTASATYTGAAIVPTIMLKDTETATTAIDESNYDVTYKQQTATGYMDVASMKTAGNYLIVISGKTLSYGGTRQENFTIAKADMGSAVIEPIEAQRYNDGAELKPEVTVTFNGTTVDASEYDVIYGSNTEVGTATVTVKAKGVNFTQDTQAASTFIIKIKELQATNLFADNLSYTSYYATQDMDAGAGIAVYVITGVSGNTAVTTQLNYIPKNTPVLLEKISGMATGGTNSAAENMLRHADADTQVASSTGTVYVLYNDMYVRATGNAVPAGKNYLLVPGTANARWLNIGQGEDATGIQTLETTAEDDGNLWYDMQGRRINRPAKGGLYIKNGKKTVIK